MSDAIISIDLSSPENEIILLLLLWTKLKKCINIEKCDISIDLRDIDVKYRPECNRIDRYIISISKYLCIFQ